MRVYFQLRHSKYCWVTKGSKQPRCIWGSQHELLLLLESGHGVRLGSRIELRATGLLGPSASPTPALMLAGDSSTTVEDDASAPLPVAVLVAPTTLGFCDALLLDGSSSKGIGLTYTWSCMGCDSSTDSALLDMLLSTPSTSPRVTLDALSFGRADNDYTFSLVVTDFLGRRSFPKNIVVTRSSLALPLIAVDGSADRTDVDTEKEMTIGASAEFSACASAQKLVFSWVPLPVSSDTGQGLNGSGGSRRIHS